MRSGFETWIQEGRVFVVIHDTFRNSPSFLCNPSFPHQRADSEGLSEQACCKYPFLLGIYHDLFNSNPSRESTKLHNLSNWSHEQEWMERGAWSWERIHWNIIPQVVPGHSGGEPIPRYFWRPPFFGEKTKECQPIIDTSLSFHPPIEFLVLWKFHTKHSPPGTEIE